MIEVNNLQYRYGITKESFAIRDVNIRLETGMITCLLGKNGAGKTTLLRLLYGMYHSGKGEILWNGKKVDSRNLAEYRTEVAYIGDEEWCTEGMTVRENTDLLKLLYPSFDGEYYEKLIRLAGMKKELDQEYFKLSKGQKVKAELAFTLARRPKMLLLDEPFANIDPVFKTDILELIQNSVAENETGILVSTHLTDEISDIVDQILIMESGSIVRSGNRFELLGSDGEKSLRDIVGR